MLVDYLPSESLTDVLLWTATGNSSFGPRWSAVAPPGLHIVGLTRVSGFRNQDAVQTASDQMNLHFKSEDKDGTGGAPRLFSHSQSLALYERSARSTSARSHEAESLRNGTGSAPIQRGWLAMANISTPQQTRQLIQAHTVSTTGSLHKNQVEWKGQVDPTSMYLPYNRTMVCTQ